MADFTNPTNDELLYTFAAKNGDTLTTKNGSKWIWQGGQWYPFAFGSESKIQNLTATLSSGELGKLRRGTSTAIGQGRGYIGADRLNDLLSWLIPTDMEMLTFWRPGDVFMRWDGEWVYRDDPTRIAF